MNLALFSELSVRDHFDSAVTQQAERRIFELTEKDILTNSTARLIDNILTILSPGRLVLDPAVNEELRTDERQRMRIRRWMEFCGSARLTSLRPRQYYATPPVVSMLQPPAGGQTGRILLEQTVSTLSEKSQFDDYCTLEFGKITDYVGWVNDDLDYCEQIARNWLLTLLDSKVRHFSGPDLSDLGEDPVTEEAAGTE
jgi:hypothetical protein